MSEARTGTAVITLAFSRFMLVTEWTTLPGIVTPSPTSNSLSRVEGVPRDDATLKEPLEDGEYPPVEAGCKAGWVWRELSESVASSSPRRSGEPSARRIGRGGSSLSSGEPL